MPDRWRVVNDGPDWTVYRNGAWYSDVEDQEEAEALMRNQRARSYVLRAQDGYETTERL